MIVTQKKNQKVIFFDKAELDGLKKIIETKKVSDYEVLTDSGFVSIENLHKTIPYEVWNLKLSSGEILRCADNHVVFKKDFEEIFVKNLSIGDEIFVNRYDIEVVLEVVESVINTGVFEEMYDLELCENSNRRYFTNGILSHNTHLAKTLSKFLFDTEDSFVRFDMSEFMEPHSVSKLIGAPPGYVGHEEKGQLTEKIKNRPYSIVLFDEIEKAHPDIYNILLQILDEGKLTDSTGKVVNFKNTIIILTSNIGTDKILSEKKLGFNSTSTHFDVTESVMSELKKKFKPELINRIDEKVVFKPIGENDVLKIVENELSKLVKRLQDKGYKITIQLAVKKFIAETGYDRDYGARPLKRAITTYIESPIAKFIINENPKEGSVLKLIFDKKDNKVIVKI